MKEGFLNIDPKKLVYFAAIVEHGSFKRAAKSLGLSQPALSMSMDRLEANLSAHLLERGPTGVTPTRLGDILYAHARLIRSELVMAEKDLREAISSQSGEIRLGALPSLAGGVIPAALSQWHDVYPEAGLHVVEAAQIDLLTGVLQRDFDLVIGYTQCYDLEAGLRQRVLFRDRLCVIARPEHPLASRSSLIWEEVVKFPWISPTSRRPHAVLEAVLRIAKVPAPAQTTFCGSAALQKSLIAASNHLAMLPEHAVRSELNERRLVRLPIADPALNRNIAVFHREGYDPPESSRALVDLIARVGLALCRESDPQSCAG